MKKEDVKDMWGWVWAVGLVVGLGLLLLCFDVNFFWRDDNQSQFLAGQF